MLDEEKGLQWFDTWLGLGLKCGWHTTRGNLSMVEKNLFSLE